MGISVLLDGKTVSLDSRLPLLPLRDIVIFPGTAVPIFLARPSSVAAVEKAAAEKSEISRRLLFALAQKRPEVSSPRLTDLQTVGVVVRMRQWLRLPDGTMRVLIEGLARASLRRLHEDGPCLEAEVAGGAPEPKGSVTALRLLQQVRESFAEYAGLRLHLPPEALAAELAGTDPTAVCYRVASHLLLKVGQRQELLEAPTPARRLRLLAAILASEIEVARLERTIEVRAQAPPFDRDLAPRRQDPRASAHGLRRREARADSEMDELRAAIRRADLPAAAEERADRELDRLSKMAFLSPEATVVRTYIDWLLALPWRHASPDRTSIADAEAILEGDHYGLAQVKQRILEHIAVIQLCREVKGPVLCLVGPPGVGKTSLGRSVARALDRRFVRMSLGGVRDEAEIRGHRRTYVGSMPGRILQAMRRAGTANPVILLDEVDKLGMDYRGDPAAALLEVLDPEQNQAFNDHYLELDYDLSKALFLTTANTAGGIPPALLDRMEIIRIPGYLETEKTAIAERFLLPKQRGAAGLSPEEIEVTASGLRRLIREYTREAGVRGLERELASLCRKTARRKASGMLSSPAVIDGETIEATLGVPRYAEPALELRDRIGLATGLAWSEAGGTILQIEVGVLPGRGKLLLTGKLGKVMRESAQAALSCIRARAGALGLDEHFHRRVDIHIHVPEGEVPKEGPSAGAAIALALASALTRVPTRKSVALTGEMTLRGQVLPVGGLTEKAVAALRAGVRTILIPQGNRRSLSEIPAEIRQDLRFVCVRNVDQVLRHGLARERGRTTKEVRRAAGGDHGRFGAGPAALYDPQSGPVREIPRAA